ncbi:hypothetical protein AD006_07890 [Pseudonocardia sp. EC080610-09]|nr:helix-turn-helix domain-containing protein [Pseudonocardia sp. EC080619-01]ALE71965.1 hypothetical protein FRP1_00250 [Pseudonocardia sp. EC080625-04]ALL78249.1 hypothetical protein AD006_01110 [Pseudonocardia sp. EC080610-09]ALE75860.1 hypothetical protein FRP1_00085 [Pseudonocardia sp. EC080625-04]ALE76570.1 hypothetical protein FRP1_21940 [Pseudonocardia sp. EC080625-04]ALE76898.1 hypothetical protein FRP1_29505 [Pseudonocardia sp. EC080625-04]
MVTVGKNVVEVEARLVAGRLECRCGGRLRPWGHARARVLRGTGALGWRLRPRRARCSGCGTTHVLLPVGVLARRADLVAVIGAALALAATGWGHRRVAERVGRAAGTVRGWLRRWRARAEGLRVEFTALAAALDPLAAMPDPASSGTGDAVAALLAAAAAVTRRWAATVDGLSPWELAGAVTSGRLLAPPSSTESINTRCPW